MSDGCCCEDCVELIYCRDTELRDWARWDAQDEEYGEEVPLDEDARLELARWEQFIEHGYGTEFVDELRETDKLAA